jgi:hypothetical protein
MVKSVFDFVVTDTSVVKFPKADEALSRKKVLWYIEERLVNSKRVSCCNKNIKA